MSVSFPYGKKRWCNLYSMFCVEAWCNELPYYHELEDCKRRNGYATDKEDAKSKTVNGKKLW